MDPRAFLVTALLVVASTSIGTPTSAAAQDEPERPRRLELTIGGAMSIFGGSEPTGVQQGDEATGSGASVLLTYLVQGSRGASGLYVGGLFTELDDECPPGYDCDMSARVLLTGGSIRLELPLPYASPSITVGLGLTAGRLNTVPTGIPVPTYLALSDEVVGERETTVRGHLRSGLGLAFGRDRRHRIGFEVFLHKGSSHTFGLLTYTVAFPRS